MRLFPLMASCLFMSIPLYAQPTTASQPSNTENIYTIKQQYLYKELHNPNDQDNEDDNELAKFNRWFHLVEVRCYPSGNLPRPDVILAAQHKAKSKRANKQTTGAPAWQPVGPTKVPTNHNGIGRINCIVIDPQDTNKLYVGAACGGVSISHDGGTTWVSNSDNFPSLSVADIAVNPLHTDTLYAATGDGYGYETGGFNIFWGGLYSAGVMKSTDGGATWHTTGLSYLQTSRDIIQRLLIHSRNPNILMAATRNGIYRTTDAGATWSLVDGGHVFSMAFRPGSPDTVYAVNNSNLRVSYDAGANWQTLHLGINPTGDRCTIAVSPVAPNAIWVLDANDKIQWSHNGGNVFYTANPPDTANFYGYYDRVLAVSPTDSNYVIAFGMIMAVSSNGGGAWSRLNPTNDVHVDNHAATFNPLNAATIYTGNDGGISVTHDGGASWKNLGSGLMISQIYRMSSSQQNPYIMICGLQDNGTFCNNGTNWLWRTGGDGEACAIHPWNDYLQVSSSQNGNFYISYDQGLNFTYLHITSQTGDWTAPVIFDPSNQSTIYFGFKDIFATYDQGSSFVNLTHTTPFSGGATCLAIAPSSSNVIYAADKGTIYNTLNAGTTWTNVRGNLPNLAITDIAVDPRDSMVVYVTLSGYTDGSKLFMSTTGGTTWINISSDLPNLPANCIAIDSSTPGAMFVGTDIGVYYTDSSQTGWTIYNTGLPNVIIDDLEVNWGNYNIRAATFGRGVWECKLKKDKPTGVTSIDPAKAVGIRVFPNPTTNNWRLLFQKQQPTSYSVKVTDLAGRIVLVQENKDLIDATKLASGVYNIEVIVDDAHYNIKAVRK
jgi:photosystem II stability/assembly factor-like uncharacterized protein